MLTSLFIQDVVLIERLSLTISTGLTALTGETGAGKSILLDALSLATGGRAERGMLRHGAEQAIVSATFEPSPKHGVWSLLKDNGIVASADDNSIILRRILNEDGRGRAFINDQPVSVALLKTIGEILIEVHGQHQGQGFLHIAAHRGLLDEYAGAQKQLEQLAQCWATMKAAKQQLEKRQQEKETALREADYLRHIVKELSLLAPQQAEEETLANRRAHLMAAEKIAKDLTEVVSLISESGIENKLTSAIGRLERASEQLGENASDTLPKLVQQLDTILTDLNEAQILAADVEQAFVADERELDKVEERLFALRAAARKHNVATEKLPDLLIKAQGSLDLIEEDAAALTKLEKELWQAEQSYLQLAAQVSKQRKLAAMQLDKAVAAELAPLKLGSAKFHVEVKFDEALHSEYGSDHVQFLISTNPGTPLGPLKQIASGGELSRFVLALKAALMAKEDRTVIIFDEVDAGVGGAVADAVGERLAKLAKNAQVMVVTHSPQVAARAALHWQVSKSGKAKATTVVTSLLPEQRIEEIARMISGAKITPAAREAAKALLEAGNSAKPKSRKRAKAS